MRLKLSVLLTQLSLGTAATLIGLSPNAIAASAGVTDQMIQDSPRNGAEVLSSGLGTQGQRYSPLKQISTGNVAKLLPAWAFSFGGEKQRGQESQPLIHDARCSSPPPTPASTHWTRPAEKSFGNMNTACPKASCPAAMW